MGLSGCLTIQPQCVIIPSNTGCDCISVASVSRIHTVASAMALNTSSGYVWRHKALSDIRRGGSVNLISTKSSIFRCRSFYPLLRLKAGESSIFCTFLPRWEEEHHQQSVPNIRGRTCSALHSAGGTDPSTRSRMIAAPHISSTGGALRHQRTD